MKIIDQKEFNNIRRIHQHYIKGMSLTKEAKMNITNSIFKSVDFGFDEYREVIINNCVYDNCDFTDTYFSRSILMNNKFINCELSYTTFNKCMLVSSDMSCHDLTLTKFTNSNIHRLNLYGCVYKDFYVLLETTEGYPVFKCETDVRDVVQES